MNWLRSDSGHWNRTNAAIAAAGIILASVIGIVGIVVAVQLAKGSVQVAPSSEPRSDPDSTSTIESPSPTPSPTPTPEPATPLLPTPTPRTTTPQSPSSNPESNYLADLKPVGYREPTGTDPQSINGRSYPHSVSASSGGCARNQETEIQWVLGGRYRQLTATIGLNDDTTEEPRVRIEIETDGRTRFSEDMKAGDKKEAKIDIDGVKRLTFRQVYLGPKPHICSENATAVWGDARVTTA